MDDNNPKTFEGNYRINGRYFGHTPQNQAVVAMPMLGTTEEWTITNESFGAIEGIWGEWHPFHIHQNDFVVTEINGLSTDDIKAYPSNQLADTVLLGGAYIGQKPQIIPMVRLPAGYKRSRSRIHENPYAI